MARYAKAVVVHIMGGKRRIAAFYQHIYAE